MSVDQPAPPVSPASGQKRAAGVYDEEAMIGWPRKCSYRLQKEPYSLQSPGRKEFSQWGQTKILRELLGDKVIEHHDRTTSK